MAFLVLLNPKPYTLDPKPYILNPAAARKPTTTTKPTNLHALKRPRLLEDACHPAIESHTVG